MYIEVVPAYGRDFKTAKAAKEHWNSDKDWRETTTDRYIRKSEAESMGLKVILRFDQNRKTTSAK